MSLGIPKIYPLEQIPLTLPPGTAKNVRTDKFSGATILSERVEQKTGYGRVVTAEDVGRVVRHKRKELGVLQEKVADLADVGTKFLSQLENGKKTAELGKVLQVLHSLGLELNIYPRSAPGKEG